MEAYISTLRVHWLVEELQNIGITEIKVTEYFRPYSRISLLEFKCPNNLVEGTSKLIHKVGTTGNAVDHYISVKDSNDKEDIFKLDALG